MKLISKEYSYLTGITTYKIFGIKISFKNVNFEEIKLLKSKIGNLEEQIKTLQVLLNYATDITKIAPAGNELRKAQLESLEILKTIKTLFENNNIKYWLAFGTLLGAVRHKGFVPWDDDIDICMFKEDFYSVIPLLKQKFENTDYYVREQIVNHYQLRIERKDNNLIGVDIFPVEKICVNDINDKNSLNKDIKNACNELENIVCENRTIDNIRKNIKILTDKFKNKYSGEIEAIFYSIDYPFTYKNLFHKNDTVFPLSSIKFEGITLSCPNNPEEYLSDMYGDFMKYPKNLYIIT